MTAHAARIFVVDDDYESAFAIAFMLREAGFSVDWYTDPRRALESFHRGGYDLALLDAKMPDLDGFALYEAISKEDPEIKSCILTASYETGHDLLTRFPNMYRGSLLQKPVTLSELVKTINLILCGKEI